MASSNTPSNPPKTKQQKNTQNVANQLQANIEQKTAEAIAANEKTPTASEKNDKKNRSVVSPPKRQGRSNRRPPSSGDGFSQSRCLMFFPTSGRMGFEKVRVSDELPPIETLREMIAYETNIRLSEPIQELMDVYHTDEAALRRILDLIQQHVVEHFGYHHVNALRTALHRFPDDPAVKSAYYVKHNKVTQGLINQGQCARDVELYTTEGQPMNLFSQIQADQPLIILAGSTS
ncbi:unnamed protein product [Rotaria magnacalcarata]|uniref:Uncharacterized protein n=4 Tax=Rotaria magnacalcarata TaxID=392030 RepID=A0A816X8B2_9BILA|nr:unnamed protein product [Rotaria magnacalcarata]CAF1631826.1 unnamed protein product [Rotaria magnacalcarata]CAF2083024.1 unnamed protein product [Rotaria magnacalcarata]CAF2142995.1 unnamed protein product [Rotaria magnacalcarata]CAF4270428.1 unnamed protein product [Rotaria magnacalcarata]